MAAMRRIGTTVAMGLALLGATAPPAWAHSVDGAETTNYRAELDRIDPVVDGIEVRLIEHGSRIEVTNRTGEEVVVLGYQGEPYLRVGPDGVFENRRSPATYLNRDRDMTSALPGSADPDAAPDWQRVSEEPTARWHDHRMHFMGEQDPQVVRDEPGRRHVISSWEVEMEHGGATIAASGELVWVPGPSALPWLLLAALLLAATAAVALTSGWAVGLALAALVLVAADVGHVVGIAAFPEEPLSSSLGSTLGGSILSLIGWVAGLTGAVLLLRRRPEGLFAVGIAGISVAVNGGVSDLSSLSASQLPFAGPGALARMAVAVALGLGFGLVVAAFLGVQRHPVRLGTAAAAQAKPGGGS